MQQQQHEEELTSHASPLEDEILFLENAIEKLIETNVELKQFNAIDNNNDLVIEEIIVENIAAIKIKKERINQLLHSMGKPPKYKENGPMVIIPNNNNNSKQNISIKHEVTINTTLNNGEGLEL